MLIRIDKRFILWGSTEQSEITFVVVAGLLRPRGVFAVWLACFDLLIMEIEMDADWSENFALFINIRASRGSKRAL